MPIKYTFNCNSCGYNREILHGSHYMPFDSKGKMWSYKMYICSACGRPDSRYVPGTISFNCHCRVCGSAMRLVKYVSEMKNLPCPECEGKPLQVRGSIQRQCVAPMLQSA